MSVLPFVLCADCNRSGESLTNSRGNVRCRFCYSVNVKVLAAPVDEAIIEETPIEPTMPYKPVVEKAKRTHTVKK